MDEQRMWKWLREKRSASEATPNVDAAAPRNEKAARGETRNESLSPKDETASRGEAPVDETPSAFENEAADEVDAWMSAQGHRSAPPVDEPPPPTRPPRAPAGPAPDTARWTPARDAAARNDSPWVAATHANVDPLLTNQAKQTLRQALEAFRNRPVDPSSQTPPPTPRGRTRDRRGTEVPAVPDAAAEAFNEENSALGKRRPRTRREAEEDIEYLEDVMNEYARFVGDIGHNEYNAPMLLYYRDEVQELLDDLDEDSGGIDLQPYWRRTVELDNMLRDSAQTFVDEVGWANFKQYQIINDPPRKNWWWYLNTETRSPPPPAAFWQFWRR